jgi:RimJ/RimL family protein N-acetyltransferase
MIAIAAQASETVGLACLEPSDGEALLRLWFRLSPETIRRRFFSPLRRPEQARPERLLDVDHRDREAVVALVDDEIVGVARYARRPGSDSAEIAVVVADAWQRRGIATRMLAALAARARCEGVRRFTATAQGDNRAVVGLLRQVFPGGRMRFEGGYIEAEFEIGEA